MIQLLPLRILYLVFTALLMLFEVFPAELSFMRVLRVKVRRLKNLRIALSLTGFILGLLTLFLPIQPGPVILGDFLPSLALVLSAFHYMGKVTEEEEAPIINAYWEYGSFRYAVLDLVVVVLDILFPTFILL